MKRLRTIRMALALFFLAAAAAFLILGERTFAVAAVSQRSQIILSSLSTSLGATLFWIIVTLLFGRVYCSTVCPVGTLQDTAIRLRPLLGRRRVAFAYRPARNVRYHILAIYVVCLLVGMTAVPYWIEPWNIMRNICSVFNPSAVEATWIDLGLGMATGIASGIVSAVLIALCSLLTGRGFCTAICPVGTALGCMHQLTLFHIEFDPDRCTNCMKCEDTCKSHCIKVAGRYVDNSRCVRCFDCIAVCDHNAIRFQPNRNRRGTPLMQRHTANP